MKDLAEFAEQLRERQRAARYDRPLPNPDAHPYTRPFWEAAAEERLVLQRCTDCGEAQFFPRPWCRHCASTDLEWEGASGDGTVYSYTVIRRTVRHPEFDPDVPYVVVYVDLEEGPRMFSQLVDCDVEDAAVGTPVEVTFERATEEITLPKFRPSE